MERKVNLDNNKKDNLIKLLKRSKLFDEIWMYEYGYDYKTKDTITVVLAPDLNGKYWKLFEEISQDNVFLNEYKLSIEQSGNIPPSIVAGFQNTHDKFDFNFEVNRLIWAVHYITTFTRREYH